MSLISTTCVNLKNFHPNHWKAYHSYYKSTTLECLHIKNITVHFSGKNNVLYLYYTRSKGMGAVVYTRDSSLISYKYMPNSATKAKSIHWAVYFVFSLTVATTTTTKKKKPHKNTRVKGFKFYSAIILLIKIKQFLAVLHLSLRYSNGKNVGFETSFV